MRGYRSKCVATAADAWLPQQMRGYRSRCVATAVRMSGLGRAGFILQDLQEEVKRDRLAVGSNRWHERAADARSMARTRRSVGHGQGSLA
jgi:hypothetical protein